MCNLVHTNPVHCDRCDKTIRFFETKLTPCDIAKQSGMQCGKETCKTSYTKSKTVKYLLSWQSCKQCGSPKNIMKAMSLNSNTKYGKNEVRVKIIGQNDPFAKIPRPVNSPRCPPSHKSKFDTIQPNANEDIEKQLESAELQNMRHMRHMPKQIALREFQRKESTAELGYMRDIEEIDAEEALLALAEGDVDLEWR